MVNNYLFSVFVYALADITNCKMFIFFKPY